MTEENNRKPPADEPSNNPPAESGAPMPSKPHTESPGNAQNARDATLNRKGNDSKAMTPFEIVYLFFSGFTFVAIVVSALVYFYQLGEMRKATEATKIAANAAEKAAQIAAGQLEQMKSGSEQTNRIIAEAGRISDSLEESLRQSKAALDASVEASRMDQRAWVGIQSVSISVLEPSQSLAVEGVAANIGKTYAVDLKVPTILVISQTEYTNGDGLEKSYAMFMASSNIKRRESGALFPTGTLIFPVPSGRPITIDEANGIKSGTLFVYLIGDIIYTDIYGVSHTTQFCYTYMAERKTFAMCPWHNRAG